MAVNKFGPLYSLYNIDRSNVANLIFGPLNIVCGGRGEIWVEKGFKLYMHIIVWKTRSKINASCEENKDQIDQTSQLFFFNDCSLKMVLS